MVSIDFLVCFGFVLSSVWVILACFFVCIMHFKYHEVRLCKSDIPLRIPLEFVISAVVFVIWLMTFLSKF